MTKKQEIHTSTQRKGTLSRLMFSVVLTPLQILLVGIVTSVFYLLSVLIQIIIYMCSIMYVSAASLFLGSQEILKKESWITC